METIRVPVAPREAFNKNRRVSDLIRKQVDHFKHVEPKLPAEVREAIPRHAIVTEDDAARYISAMTRALRGKAEAAKAPGPIPIAAPAAFAPEAEDLALAASAETAAQAAQPPASKTGSASKARKSSFSKGKK